MSRRNWNLPRGNSRSLVLTLNIYAHKILSLVSYCMRPLGVDGKKKDISGSYCICIRSHGFTRSTRRVHGHFTRKHTTLFYARSRDHPSKLIYRITDLEDGGCIKKKNTRDEYLAIIVKALTKSLRQSVTNRTSRGSLVIYATCDVAKGGLESGRELCYQASFASSSCL